MKVKWYGTGLSGIIKDRGMDYYRHNQVHVKTVEVTENEKIRFTAEVEGTELYRVTALVSELGDVSGLSCTCPYASRGNPCKHMAALLLHVSYWHIPKEMQRELMSRRYAAELKRQAKAEEARNPSLAFRLFALREW